MSFRVVQRRKDFSPLRVDPGANERRSVTGGRSQRFERGDWHDHASGRHRQALYCRNSYAQAGERSWSSDDREEIDGVERTSRLVEHSHEVERQAFAMRARFIADNLVADRAIFDEGCASGACAGVE